jgi:hypothetical protein
MINKAYGPYARETLGGYYILLKTAVFWVAAPCNLVEVYQRFGGTCCLHQGDEGDDVDESCRLDIRREEIKILKRIFQRQCFKDVDWIELAQDYVLRVSSFEARPFTR